MSALMLFPFVYLVISKESYNKVYFGILRFDLFPFVPYMYTAQVGYQKSHHRSFPTSTCIFRGVTKSTALSHTISPFYPQYKKLECSNLSSCLLSFSSFVWFPRSHPLTKTRFLRHRFYSCPLWSLVRYVLALVHGTLAREDAGTHP